ncbi:hypothetical protein ACEWY4_018718 [Coilia grayii]|uniref:TNFR-Cys domain-containing protein n=1 Tax=Coilia grayii TaxID=363190 RepID=A0ABD1JH41_9TELE
MCFNVCVVGLLENGEEPSPVSCPAGSYFSSGLCVECFAGYYCLGNLTAPRRCPPGTYNLYPGKDSMEDCQPCALGLISSDNGVDCRLCPFGYACDPVNDTLSLCPSGTFSPEGHSSCLPCPAGLICQDGHQSRCGPGQEPNAEQTECVPCPAGSYSLPLTSHCLPCPIGKCSVLSITLSGTFCPQEGLSQPLSCPPGEQTTQRGQSSCQRCNGTAGCQASRSPLWNRAGGPRSRPQQPCPAGMHRDEAVGCVSCPVGFYCLEGMSRRPSPQFLCPAGFYCEEGTAVPHGSPCPAGTAGGQLGQTSRASCKRCEEGRYCPEGIKDCLRCPAGFYCPEGTSDPVPCQPGSFNPLDGQDSPQDCRLCYPGKACTRVALRTPDVDCMPGFVCPPGSARPNLPSNACPPGTLSNRTDLTDHTQCQLCPARFACLRGTGGNQRPPLSCFPGHYCPVGTMFPTQYKCPPGTWSERSGLESERECRPCPRGWYCLTGTGAPSGRCSSGHYCPDGTMYGTQHPCPAGTYSTMMGNGQRADCLMCPPGYFCKEGTSKPTPCPPATYRRIKGGQGPRDCPLCPAGYYCPQSATVQPRVCGVGSYSDEGSVECLPCRQGHYCSNETTSEEVMLNIMVCPPGFLCYQGLDREPQRSAVFCPAGFYCPGGGINPNPILCPNGTYGTQSGLKDESDCLMCPAGMFCFSQDPDQPITEPTGSCPDGHYCPPGTGPPNSFPCPPGSFRNDSLRHGGESCVPCPARHYCAASASHTPSGCPRGFYCPEGSTVPTPCEEGTYGPRAALSDASECAACGGGRYCSGVGQTEPSGTCEAGFYCRHRATTATPIDGPSGGLCPVGSYCPPGSPHPSPCPPGFFSNSTGLQHLQQCVSCPPGFYCLGSNNSAPSGPCAAGFYCTGGADSPMQMEAEEGHFSLEGAVRAQSCPLGTFQPVRGQRRCLECPAGRLCNETGLSQPHLCPSGHYCTSGSSIAQPCPPGTYFAHTGAVDVTHCSICDAGQFCQSPGLSAPEGPCAPGFYCTGGSNTATPVNSASGDMCPAGYVCLSGSMHPHGTPCPPGTLSSLVGGQDMSTCWMCPPGYFCNDSALTHPTGVCAPGFYCTGGATSSMPEDGESGGRCPAGSFCPQGSSSPSLCPEGYFSNSTGTHTWAQVGKGGHRWARVGKGGPRWTQVAKGGHRWVKVGMGGHRWARVECQHCPPGKVCLQGEDPEFCPRGHFCMGGTIDDILPCPPGTYNPLQGQNQLEQCLLCPPGINFRNPDGNISTGVGGVCPRGHYCPEGTSLTNPCPPGTYSNSLYLTEVSSCSLCPPGVYCGTGGLSRPSGPCQQGYYCPPGSTTATGFGGGGGPCPVSHYCPEGSANPEPCPAGTYANLPGQPHCNPCQPGYFCPDLTSNYLQYPCPPGFYCPEGTKQGSQFPCPRGYYNPEALTQSLDSCLPCPAGHYCEKEGLSAVSGKCKAGWFCVSAAWTAQPFDLDNYTSANCLCPATSTGGRCQKGFFCPFGSSEPQPCPAGAFCNSTGLSLPSGPCLPGFYCTGRAFRPNPRDGLTGNICPPGAYCGEASEEPERCPVGTFSMATGLVRRSECQTCTEGHYCSSPGLHTPTGPCSEGYWCPAGQEADRVLQCPVGHYCPLGSPAPLPCPSGSYQHSKKQANCSLCHYCDHRLASSNISVRQPCPTGHFCPPGTPLATQYPCPAGTYNPREGMSGPDACLPCPSGQWLPDWVLVQRSFEVQHPLKRNLGFPMPRWTLLPCSLPPNSPRTPHGPFLHPLDPLSAAIVPPFSPPYLCPVTCAGVSLPVPSHLCRCVLISALYPVQLCPYLYPVTCAGVSLPVPSHLCRCVLTCALSPVQVCPYLYPVTCAGVSFPVPSHLCRCVLTCALSPVQVCPYLYPVTCAGVSLPVPSHLCRCVLTSALSPVQVCPYLCPLTCAGVSFPVPCPAGTWAGRTGLGEEGECQRCPGGSYCAAPALTAPTGPCAGGFYCAGGALVPTPTDGTTGGPCPEAHYCPIGTFQPVPCEPGTYMRFYCPEGMGSMWRPCPVGTYGPSVGLSEVAECRVCDGGHYCSVPNATSVTGPCAQGYYCLPGSTSARPLSTGVFCASSGLSEPSGNCSAGHFCSLGAVSPRPEDGDSGARCPQGHYCPSGATVPQPCPAGRYSNNTGNTHPSDCRPCPAGFSCSSRGLSLPSGVCPAGYFCQEGGDSSPTTPQTCPLGHICPLGSPTPAPCAAGTYQDQPGQTQCAPCPAGFFCAIEGSHTPTMCPEGHYCPLGTQSGHDSPCPAGTFSDQRGLTSRSQCAPCPPGQYCSSAGLSAPTGACSPGYVCSQGSVQPQPTSFETGNQCPAGHYCPAGISHALPCPPGTYNTLPGAVSDGACEPCPAGQFCSGFGLTAPSGPCTAGYYCTRGATSPTPHDTQTDGDSTVGGADVEPRLSTLFTAGLCPKGYFCPSGTSQPMPCPPGNPKNPCPAPPGSSKQPMPSFSGTFLGWRGAELDSNCTSCSPGFYCPDWGQTSVQRLCPEGWFCPAGSEAGVHPDQQCLVGHACPSGSAEPSVCPAGTYQPAPAHASCRPCPAGFFCLEGTSVPWPCPMGTLGGSEGLQDQQSCSPCPPGHYCNSSGLSLPSGPCKGGHYCVSGSPEPAPVSQEFGDICPLGHFCPEQSSAPLPCPAGTFLLNRGASSHLQCSSCPPGAFCLSPGSPYPTGACSPGYYCTGESASSEPQANASQMLCFCYLLPPHSQSDYSICCEGNHTTCPQQISGGADSWLPVEITPEVLMYTESESPTQSTGGECADFRGAACPKGFYCPEGSILPVPCEVGFYCAVAGLPAPSGPCDAGFYCPKGSKDPAPTTCPPAHYCPPGTPYPQPCPPGTMRSAASEADCPPCPPGHFCGSGAMLEPSGECSSGYFCPGGQSSPNPPQYVCRVGHLCQEGSVRGTPCPAGSYQAREGQSECVPCSAGSYCPHAGMVQPDPCTAGFYCPPGVITPTPCPPGTYANRTRMAHVLDCTLCKQGMFCRGSGNESPTGSCDPGFLCLGGASSPAPTDGVTGILCPEGFYCPAGSYTPLPCPKGTFSERTGLGHHSECQPCSPGFYCAEPGLTAVSGPCLAGFFCLGGSPHVAPVGEEHGDLCPEGHFCATGTALPTACPPGTHRSETGARTREECLSCSAGWFQDRMGQMDCKPCPARFYCPSSGVVTPIACPQGFFCSGEATLDTPIPCPKGTYGGTEGLATADECLLCPAGSFCGSDGLSRPSGSCASGFLCLSRAAIPNPTDNRTGAPCPPGAFCRGGIVAGQCSPGYYCSGGSTSPEGVLCPAGSYCPRGSPSPIPCESGTFSSATGATHPNDCTTCPPGFYCQGEGLVQPEMCPPGHFCPPGTSLAQQYPCPPGTLLPQHGATSPEECLPCPAGMFCARPGLSEPTGPCQEGFHCSPGSSSPNGTDINMQVESAESPACPPGFYCPAGTSHPVPCPPGTLSSSPGLNRPQQCQPCPGGLWCGQAGLTQLSEASLCEGGYVCVGGSMSPRPDDGIMGYLCPPGHSCAPGSAVEVPCVPGTHSSGVGAANCTLCPAGTHCPSSGTQEPELCPPGHFCPVGTALPHPCPAGTLGRNTGAPSETFCSPCPTGLYCSTPGASQPQGQCPTYKVKLPSQGQCEPGYYCQGGASSPAPQPSAELPQNGPCPLGHYCPPGTLSPLPCPTGTVRNITGGVSLESCFPCPGGHYCEGEGLHSPTGTCEAGFYCPADSASTSPHALICTKGHFCPEGSPMPLPCPTGQYQPNVGSDFCIPCRPGFYCEEAVVGDPSPCPPHTYCPAATMVPVPCPNGTFTPRQQGGLKEERECLPCPPGKYCRAGQIKGSCAAGYVCLSGSSEFTPQDTVPANRSVCEWGVQCAGPCPAGDPVLYPCPTGHYCDGIVDYESGGRPGPRRCPMFTYRATTGAGSKGDCHPCPPGTLCNSSGLTGYSGFPCPAGFWCSGSSLPVLCPAGTFRSQPGASSATHCARCDPGTYCPNPHTSGVPNTAGIPCRASYQCPTGSAQESVCAAGHYCAPRTGDPPPCSQGYVCPPGSHTYSTPQQRCLFPFFCPMGSAVMQSCPGGFMPVNGTGPRASLERFCQPCQAGTYRPAMPSALNCQPCPPGYHCQSGGYHYPAGGYHCPSGGYYCSSGAFYCPSGGYFCNSGGYHCPPGGHYCPSGAFCCHSGGYYCPSDRYYCPSGGFYYPSAGFYCHSGAFHCPSAGYYWPLGGFYYSLAGFHCSLGRFYPLSGGFYCGSGGLYYPSVGFYCHSGPFHCPSGGYCCPSVGNYCPSAGYYCHSGGYHWPSGRYYHPSAGYHWPSGAEGYASHPCPVGHYCPRGSPSPVPCPPGSYGDSVGAEGEGQCQPCPAGTFNHLSAQTACFPCGSSATSTEGSSSCSCVGRNRAFQPSDGSCLCRAGFVFYNTLDLKRSSTDSHLDCQPEVSKRCAGGEVRLASSQECVKPSEHSCDVTCGAHGGALDVEMGVCQCERYVSSEELCDVACLSQLPHITARRSTDGQLLLGIRAQEGSHSWNRKLGNVVGPDSHVQDIGKIHFVQFDSDGVFGWILRDSRLIDRMLKEPVETLGNIPRRKRSYDEEGYSNDNDDATKAPPRIPNPIACLSSKDMLIFNLRINHTGAHIAGIELNIIAIAVIACLSSKDMPIFNLRINHTGAHIAGIELNIIAIAGTELNIIAIAVIACLSSKDMLIFNLRINHTGAHIAGIELNIIAIAVIACLSSKDMLIFNLRINHTGAHIAGIELNIIAIAVIACLSSKDMLIFNLRINHTGAHIAGIELNIIAIAGIELNIIAIAGTELNIIAIAGTELNIIAIAGTELNIIAIAVIACLSSKDMLIFNLRINHTDRLHSHFPVYQKDHLFNSNPSWDYGAFRRLEYLMIHTHFNSSRFAHVIPEAGTYVFVDNAVRQRSMVVVVSEVTLVFAHVIPEAGTYVFVDNAVQQRSMVVVVSEAGTYVFVDNAVRQRSMVVVVSEDGSTCKPKAPPFQPSSPAQLVRHGVLKNTRLNLLPDWALISGVLFTLLVVVVLVTSTALLLKPHRGHLISHGNPKPRWRSLGQPPTPLQYSLYNGEGPDAPSALGLRGVCEGAEAEETIIWRGALKSMGMELEEFNVKTLYDKLEDQNLHVASQLAKHRKDTQEFYRNICQQTDALRDTLENMGPEKLSQLKEIMQLNSKQSDVLCSSLGPYGAALSKDSLPVMASLLQSVEALLYRLCGEGWHQMDTSAPCLRDTRDLQTGYTPEIQDSLQSLPRSQEVTDEDPPSSPTAPLTPLPLDSLSPPHFSIFLFGCHVVRLLRSIPGFPQVLLLPARSVPMPTPALHTDSLVAYCCRDFYFDTHNQILYLLESRLQDAGRFVSVLVHAVAYISCGMEGARPRDFMEAFHKAVSLMALQLFTHTFSKEQSRTEDEDSGSSRGAVVEDFLSVKVAPDTQLTPEILEERLQKYQYFKLEQLLHDLGQAKQPEGELVVCVEQEIKRLNEVYQQLDTHLLSPGTHTHTQHSPAANSLSQAPAEAAVSQERTLLLGVQQHTIAKRLEEMRERLASITAPKRTEPTPKTHPSPAPLTPSHSTLLPHSPPMPPRRDQV